MLDILYSLTKLYTIFHKCQRIYKVKISPKNLNQERFWWVKAKLYSQEESVELLLPDFNSKIS